MRALLSDAWNRKHFLVPGHPCEFNPHFAPSSGLCPQALLYTVRDFNSEFWSCFRPIILHASGPCGSRVSWDTNPVQKRCHRIPNPGDVPEDMWWERWKEPCLEIFQECLIRYVPSARQDPAWRILCFGEQPKRLSVCGVRSYDSGVFAWNTVLS